MTFCHSDRSRTLSEAEGDGEGNLLLARAALLAPNKLLCSGKDFFYQLR
jgi:hypothetical protein